MPRSKQQNQQIKDERRRQIMDAAVKIFAEKGLSATMISDIAAACDLSYGLIYHYFHDKEELFITLVERALHGGLALTESAQTLPGTPWDRLRFVCAEMMDGLRTRPEYFRIIMQAQLSDSPSSAVRKLVSDIGERVWVNISNLIHEGQEAGEVVAGNPHTLAYLLNAFIQGMALNRSYEFYDEAYFPSVDDALRFLRPAQPIAAKEPGESKHED